MNQRRFIYYIITYLGLWAVSVIVPDVIFGDASNIFAKMMTVQVPIAEYGIFHVNLHLSTFFEFILPFIINPVFIFLFYREIKSSTPRDGANKWTIWTKYGILIAMLFFSLGYGLHYVGDALDTIIPFEWIEISLFTGNISEALILIYVKIPAYLMDEVISHKVIHFGIYGVYSGLALIQYWYPLDSNLNDLEHYETALLGGLYGCVTAIALAGGQCAFEFFFLTLGLLIFILFQIRKLDINLRELPFFIFFLFFLLGVAIAIPIWGLVTGIKPYYPFFYQINEL